MNIRFYFYSLIACLLFLPLQKAKAQEDNPLAGRWDLVVEKNGERLPSWLEVKHSGNSTLVGRFVYAFGSARPVSEIVTDGKTFQFSIPPQWEPDGDDLEFKGRLDGKKLEGVMTYTDGSTSNFTGSRAPKFNYPHNNLLWGEAQDLLGKGLEAWHASGASNQWEISDGILKSAESGSNLISNDNFKDFKLHVEFKYPEGSNSGIYLRGRYEIQITDSYGKEPSDIEFGALYGFLPPNQMAAHPAGQWQTYDITLVGNRVSIVANGISVVTDQVIPGITGGALDSAEASPGPVMLQGDHGPIEFRNMVIMPLED